MTIQPGYSRQISRKELQEKGETAFNDWVAECNTEAKAKGLHWPRIAWDETTGTILFEAWKEQLLNLPDPQFGITLEKKV